MNDNTDEFPARNTENKGNGINKKSKKWLQALKKKKVCEHKDEWNFLNKSLPENEIVHTRKGIY